MTLLEVRKGTLTGYLDGRKLATLHLEGRTLSVSSDMWKTPKRLGLVTYHNPTLFHLVEVTPR